jgi:hypothetical protein
MAVAGLPHTAVVVSVVEEKLRPMAVVASRAAELHRTVVADLAAGADPRAASAEVEATLQPQATAQVAVEVRTTVAAPTVAITKL